MPRSSQVSDPDLNDVQQSAEMLKSYLSNPRHQLYVPENDGGVSSKFGLSVEIKSLKGQAKELEATIDLGLSILLDHHSSMGYSGFPKCRN
jgi:hypothetical protein